MISPSAPRTVSAAQDPYPGVGEVGEVARRQQAGNEAVDMHGLAGGKPAVGPCSSPRSDSLSEGTGQTHLPHLPTSPEEVLTRTDDAGSRRGDHPDDLPDSPTPPWQVAGRYACQAATGLITRNEITLSVSFSSGATPSVDEVQRHLDEAQVLAVHDAAATLLPLEAAGASVYWPKVIDVVVASRLLAPLGEPHRRAGNLVADHSLSALLRRYFETDDLPADRYPLGVAVLAELLVFLLARKPGMLGLLADEMRLAALLAGIERRGMLVDVARAGALCRRLSLERAEFAQVLANVGLTPDVSTAADRHRLAALLAGAGLQVPRTTAGIVATSAEDLQRVTAAAADHIRGLVMVIAHSRELDCHARLLRQILDGRDLQDRIHPRIHGIGAITGRMSVDSPALQSAPTSGGIRECLLAEPGSVLISADYRQVEFRVAAALADEANMKKVIFDGGDLHAITARRLYGADFTSEQRELAKRAGFGRIYGGESDAIAGQCGVTLETAQAALGAFDAAYPRIAAYAAELRGRASLATRSGRPLPVDTQRPHTRINYMVQGEARDIFAASLLRLESAGLGRYLWLPVHDEIIACVPEDQARDAARAIEDAMATWIDDVPVTAEAVIIGERWVKAP